MYSRYFFIIYNINNKDINSLYYIDFFIVLQLTEEKTVYFKIKVYIVNKLLILFLFKTSIL